MGIEAKTLMSDRAVELEKKVVERLRTVFDPEIPVNLYDLGLIYRIEFLPAMEDKFDVQIDMTLTAPNCPVAGQMPVMVQQAVVNLPELNDILNDIKVELVWDPPWDKSRMSDEARLQLNMF
ncbi:MAG: iron-sulfur cluster assembly protein [Bdellovibrionales bacterium]